MSIHSSKPVMIDEIQSTDPKYKSAYADAVIQLALTKGKREEVKISISFFFLNIAWQNEKYGLREKLEFYSWIFLWFIG